MKLASTYKSFVAGSIAWADALAEALGKKKYLSAEVIESLAEAHAEAYGEKYKRTIFFQQTSSGAWVFYKDEACKKVHKDTTATRQWERDVEQYHNITKKGGKVSTKLDLVEQKSKSIKSWGMTKAQVLKAVELAFSK
jgi:hypothetical protein